VNDGPSEVRNPPSPAADASFEPVVRLSHRRRKAVLTSVMLGLFLSALDQTVISVALRTITDDLHGLSRQAWVTTAYLVTGTSSARSTGSSRTSSAVGAPTPPRSPCSPSTRCCARRPAP
jgi:hypothetical protein